MRWKSFAFPAKIVVSNFASLEKDRQQDFVSQQNAYWKKGIEEMVKNSFSMPFFMTYSPSVCWCGKPRWKDTLTHTKGATRGNTKCHIRYHTSVLWRLDDTADCERPVQCTSSLVKGDLKRGHAWSSQTFDLATTNDDSELFKVEMMGNNVLVSFVTSATSSSTIQQ